MKLKRAGSCAIIFVLLLITESFAVSSFKIQDYIPEKFTDFEWRIGGRLYFSGNDYKYTREYPDSYYIMERNRVSNSNAFRTTFENNLHYTYETVSKFVELSSALNTQINFNSTYMKETYPEGNDENLINTYENDRDNKEYNLQFFSMLEAGTYLSKNMFVAGKFSCGLYHNENLSDKYKTSSFRYSNLINELRGYKDDEETDRNFKNVNDNVSIEFLPGWGHVYEGMYNSTALYIFEELDKNGLLSREPTSDEIGMLSELIYHNRLEHAVDYRLRRIEIFEQLMDFLEKQAIINDTDSQIMIYISDVWDYFPIKRRQFGSRIRIGGGYEYDYNKYEQTSDGERTSIVYYYQNSDPSIIDSTSVSISNRNDRSLLREDNNSVFISGYYEHYKPLSRKMQFDFDSQVKYYVTKENEYIQPGSTVKLSYNHYMTFTFNPALTYIYNSRSMFTLSGSLLLIDQDVSFSDDGNSNEYFYYNKTDYDISISGKLDYRISIPTMLTVSVGYSSPLDDYRSFRRFTYPFNYEYNHRYNATLMLTHYIY